MVSAHAVFHETDWVVYNGMENSLQGERPLLKQFFVVVTPVEVCNHGPEGSELHKRMKYCYAYIWLSSKHYLFQLGIEGGSELWLLT